MEMTEWSDQEKIIALENRDKLAREVAEELELMGYPSRTKSAIRRIWHEYEIQEEETEVEVEEDNKETPSLIQECKPKILYFDIETTNFKATFGEVLMMGYRWHGEEEYKIVKVTDYEGWDELNIEDRDYYVLQDMHEIISEADVLVGHYSKRFDHRFIQSRCLYHKLPVIPNPPHVDTWHIAKYQMAIGSNSMKNIAKFLKCDNQKDSLPIHIWRRANAYDEECIEMIAEYCLQDVRTQYSMTQRLMPLANAIPNMNLLVNSTKYLCSGCGSDNVQKRGFHFTKINKYQRFQCMNCGKWSRGRNTLTDKEIKRHL
jgi:uncharacterized protein YprB with RNaseH-like and TPR domain/DNA-directed RNA polymerase subunit RPC12/RpoP